MSDLIEDPKYQYISFNITSEGLKIGVRLLDEPEELGKMARVLYGITTGKHNENILSTINDMPISEASKKTLFNAWTILVNLDKRNEPAVKPSAVFKR